MKILTMVLCLSTVLCFVFAGLNLWTISVGKAGPLNYAAAVACAGVGIHGLVLLVRRP